MQNIHCKYCHYEIMPVREDVPEIFSVMCPNCHKRITQDEIYVKNAQVDKPQLEKK